MGFYFETSAAVELTIREPETRPSIPNTTGEPHTVRWGAHVWSTRPQHWEEATMSTGASGTSAAVQIAETGGPEMMRLVQRPDPVAGEGEMTVAVAAAGVNFIDTYHRSGLYDMPLPLVLGQEGAGDRAGGRRGHRGLRPGRPGGLGRIGPAPTPSRPW